MPPDYSMKPNDWNNFEIFLDANIVRHVPQPRL